ncbi:hypothetical protein PsYK624_161530 [Phanerochaete sordida]|uniref:DUF6699 domain-containing protein n=1 Tax=Phanerochaete sordida TaxID=48140 RepID=A0A9P3LMN3_9APHY|nr:hypothetical protein PsYK624_161530 [Phanerochaete sordida]
MACPDDRPLRREQTQDAHHPPPVCVQRPAHTWPVPPAQPTLPPVPLPVMSLPPPGLPPPDALHSCLDARGAALAWDVRNCPRRVLPAYAHVARASVLFAPVRTLRLVARAFPWPLVVRAGAGGGVVCGAVWERVHAALRVPIAPAEWALLCADEVKRRAVVSAMRRRVERDPEGEEDVPLRVDYLGSSTVFLGLERDDTYVESILLPGTRMMETRVIRMGRPLDA